MKACRLYQLYSVYFIVHGSLVYQLKMTPWSLDHGLYILIDCHCSKFPFDGLKLTFLNPIIYSDLPHDLHDMILLFIYSITFTSPPNLSSTLFAQTFFRQSYPVSKLIQSVHKIIFITSEQVFKIVPSWRRFSTAIVSTQQHGGRVVTGMQFDQKTVKGFPNNASNSTYLPSVSKESIHFYLRLILPTQSTMARQANISVAVCIVLFLMFNMSGRSDGQQLPTKKPTTNAHSTVSIRIFSEWNNCS